MDKLPLNITNIYFKEILLAIVARVELATSIWIKLRSNQVN